jgi:hypothetical protein
MYHLIVVIAVTLSPGIPNPETGRIEREPAAVLMPMTYQTLEQCHDAGDKMKTENMEIRYSQCVKS